jgi:hypothetical protein
VFGGIRFVTESDLPSREVTAPCRVFSLETLAPLLLQRSPHALHPHGLDHRVFTLQAPERHSRGFRDPLVGFGSSSEVAQAPSRCLGSLVSQKTQTLGLCRAPSGSASLEVSTPSASSHSEQRPDGQDLPSRPPAPSGSRNLLAPSSAPSSPALFHAGSAPGVTLQSFLPPAQPYAVSSAVPLLTFDTPSGFCSTRESATRSSGLD